MAKIIVEDFTKDDELVVNDQLLSGQGDAPPSSPDEPEEDTANHFGDWLDDDWSHSLKWPDDVFFSNNDYSFPAGTTRTIHIPNDPALEGKNMSMGSGGVNGLGHVVIKDPFGNKLYNKSVGSPGSAQYKIAGGFLGKDITYTFKDGFENGVIQHFCS